MIIKDDTHLHYGQGQSEAILTLPSGVHKLCLQAGNGAHIALPGIYATAGNHGGSAVVGYPMTCLRCFSCFTQPVRYFYPDGSLPALPFAQRLPWPGVREGLRINYVRLLFSLGFGAANVTDGEPPGLVFFFGLAVPLIGIAAQSARYQRATQAEARQQSKVLLLSMLLSLGAGLLLLLLGLLFTLPTLGSTWEYERRFEQVTFFVFPLLFTTIPIMLFVTVVRYRLWDFDRLINRSLVYGTLTGFVVGVYVVAVGLSSALLQRQESWLLSMLV